MATADDGLTYKQRERILKGVILGAPVPANETPAAREWRLQCERDVAQCRALGCTPELPFDPTYDDGD